MGHAAAVNYLTWRREYVRVSSDELALQRFAESHYSQNGEDGMIREALRRLRINSPKFIEIGASDGMENCTRNLLENGSSGLWVEGSPDLAASATERFRDSPVDIVQCFVTVDNILATIESSEKVASGFDVLVMDTDGNDWWLLQKILGVYTPSLVVAEYNAAFGPTQEWVMPYDPTHVWRQDRYYGASLTSYDKLMRRFGYRLIGCDPTGVNAFWVQKSQKSKFATKFGPKTHFAPLQSLVQHPERGTLPMEVTFSKNDLNHLVVNSVDLVTVKTSKAIVVSVRNEGLRSVSSIGTFPVRIGMKTNQKSSEEPTRAKFSGNFDTKTTQTVFFEIDSHVQDVWIAPVQEGVMWGDWTKFEL